VPDHRFGVLDVVVERAFHVLDRARGGGHKRKPVVVVEVSEAGGKRQRLVEQVAAKEGRRAGDAVAE
jgi:hypothetical protein